ncbi:MAG: cation:dicarboxylase symporter family transporter [Spirochaetia bacterium]
MKIWIKILVGSILGVLLGIFLPGTEKSMELFSYINRLFIQIGRYVVFPLVFFALVVGTYELKREKKIFRVYGRIILYLLLSTALLVIVGMVTVLVFSPERIPIIVEQEVELQLPGFKETLLGLFPENLFQALVGSGSIMLPVVFFALLLGVNLTFDLRITSPVVQLTDSLNRIFYHINSLLCELFGFAMIVITAYFMMTVKQNELTLFKQILIIIGIDSALVIFAIFPVLLYFLGGRQNPYKWLYAVLAPALTAFFSGDNYLSVVMLAKHGKENLGVPRRVGSGVYSIFAIFGRAGTVLVASATFLLVLKSYSSLEITFFQVLWTLLFSLLISMTLGTVPGLGAYVALSTLCAIYGRGLQEGYLILRPIAPLLISFGVLLDVLTSAFVSLLVAKHEQIAEDVDVYDFV